MPDGDRAVTWTMAGPQLDPIVIAAAMFSVDRLVAQRGARVARPTGNDLTSLGAYWMAAVDAAGEDLALQVAADLPIGAFGLASYGLASAATLRDALEALGTTYLHRLIPGMALHIVAVTPDRVDVRLHGDDDTALMPLIEELGLAVIHHHLSLLTEPATVLGVELRRPAPTSAVTWKAYFGVAPRFAQPASKLSLAAASLAIELRTASPELQHMVQKVSTHDASLAPQVRAYVRAHLRDPLDADTVARALDLTARTLQRKLQAEHTSLREVTSAVRIEVARELLATTDRTVADISDAVGFAQPASFTRAFAAATGEPPAEYRKRNRS